MKTEVETPVRSFLSSLELELKNRPGVVPEDALSDAREFLQNEYESLSRRRGYFSDAEVHQHFVDTFGKPSQVAAAYAETAEPATEQKGYAPGWRICCTKCGRSGPAAKAGITRIGAWSWHKYILGYCRDCQSLRWLRLIKDQEKSNLTKRIGMDTTPEELRRTMHRPWQTVIAILVIAAIVQLVSFLLPLLLD